MANNYLEFGFD